MSIPRRLVILTTTGGASPGTMRARESARLRYVDGLDAAGAWALLDELASRARTERLALLCFEAEMQHCHRQVLLDEVQGAAGDAGAWCLTVGEGVVDAQHAEGVLMSGHSRWPSRWGRATHGTNAPTTRPRCSLSLLRQPTLVRH